MATGPNRRTFIQTTGAATAGLTLGGLLPGMATAQAEDVTLTLWTHDDGYIRFFTDMARQYNEQADRRFNISLDITQIGSVDVVTNALSAYAARRDFPDLIGVIVFQFSRFMGPGVLDSTLLDITDRVAPIRDDFYETVWQQYEADNRLYGAESAYSICVNYYRQDVFAELGAPDGFETYDEYFDFAERYLVPKGMYGGMAATSGDIWQAFVMFLSQRGGAVFDSEGNVGLDTPEAVETAQMLADGLKREIILPVSATYGGPTVAALQQGSLVSLMAADWFQTFVLAPNAPDQEGLWRIREMPRFAGGGANTSIFGGTGFCVSKDSPRAEAAWELVNYAYLTEYGQRQRFEQIKYLPTMKSLYDDPDFLSFTDPYLGDQRSVEVFASLAPNVPTLHQSPYWNDAIPAMNRALTELYNGNKSAMEAMRDAASEIQSRMR